MTTMPASDDGLTPKQRRFAADEGWGLVDKAGRVAAGPMTFHAAMMLKLRALRKTAQLLGLLGRFRRPLEAFGCTPGKAQNVAAALVVRVVQPWLSPYARIATMDMLESLDPAWRRKLSAEGLGSVVDRNSPEVRQWRKAVLKRDRRTCQGCGAKKRLHAHHIVGWAAAPWLRVVLSNGITLCNDCHAEEHPESAELVKSCRGGK